MLIIFYTLFLFFQYMIFIKDNIKLFKIIKLNILVINNYLINYHC